LEERIPHIGSFVVDNCIAEGKRIEWITEQQARLPLPARPGPSGPADQ
jgi:hypothetical protein